MPPFVARNKAGVTLGAVFLFAWIAALVISWADGPVPEDPDRWVKGPPTTTAEFYAGHEAEAD